MIRRSILEWQTLPHGDGEDCVPAWAAERLAAVARHSPLAGADGDRVLHHGRHGLGARQVVGIVAADGCVLEILPKIEGGEGHSDRSSLRDGLVHMLAVALDLPIDIGARTVVGEQDETLLEVLITLFARSLAAALRQGIPRHYVSCSDDLPSLRGSLDITRQFTAQAVSPQRLACRFDELSPDIALNRIMKAATDRLFRVSGSVENRRLLAELRYAYAGVASIPAAALRWQEVHLDRTNAKWRNLLNLARLLLGDRFQTSAMGVLEGFSLLFEMNILFEEYVGRMLKRALVGDDRVVSLQGGRRFCLQELDRGR